MKYIIEDTPSGFRISIPSFIGLRELTVGYNEEGGHGPVEHLYAQAAKVYDDLRRGSGRRPQGAGKT